MLKTLLALIASVGSFFLILGPIQDLFNYMDWPILNGGGLHAGSWTLAWPVISVVNYWLLLRIVRWIYRGLRPGTQI